MPSPIEMVYKNTIKKVVRAFIKGLPDHITRSYPDMRDENIKKLIKSYEAILGLYCQDIITSISRDISCYLNYYSISPQGSIDEFKAVYFTGRVISRFLNREGMSDLRVINDYITIHMLDWTLEKANSNSRPIMTKALRKIASENDFDHKLGIHGMYLVYKSNYNIVTENKPQL